MTITQEPITLETLNALIANFATGINSLDELWENIEEAADMSYFRQNLMTPLEFPAFSDDCKNHMPGADAEAGI
jgi:hypothetical protein